MADGGTPIPKPWVPDLLDDEDADGSAPSAAEPESVRSAAVLTMHCTSTDLAENALVIDDSLSLIERVQRYMPSEHDLHRLFTTKLMPDAAEASLASQCFPVLFMTDPPGAEKVYSATHSR